MPLQPTIQPYFTAPLSHAPVAEPAAADWRSYDVKGSEKPQQALPASLASIYPSPTTQSQPQQLPPQQLDRAPPARLEDLMRHHFQVPALPPPYPLANSYFPPPPPPPPPLVMVMPPALPEQPSVLHLPSDPEIRSDEIEQVYFMTL